MKIGACIIVSVIGVAVCAASASAGITDPRKCSYGPARKADCARDAAKLVARKVLQHKVGQAYLWQGPMTCTGAGTLLKWRCSFSTQFPQLPPAGYVAVTFRATSTGWRVRTAIVATP